MTAVLKTAASTVGRENESVNASAVLKKCLRMTAVAPPRAVSRCKSLSMNGTTNLNRATRGIGEQRLQFVVLRCLGRAHRSSSVQRRPSFLRKLRIADRCRMSPETQPMPSVAAVWDDSHSCFESPRKGISNNQPPKQMPVQELQQSKRRSCRPIVRSRSRSIESR